MQLNVSAEEAVALRDTRLAILQPLVQPWVTRAQAAFTEIDKLARANPQLAKNPAVLAAVRASRAKLAQNPPATATRSLGFFVIKPDAVGARSLVIGAVGARSLVIGGDGVHFGFAKRGPPG